MKQETPVPQAVDTFVTALENLSSSFLELPQRVAPEIAGPLWCDRVEGPKKQLKFVYSDTANEEEFLMRATLASGFVLDGLALAALGGLLEAVDGKLIKSCKGASLASRKLLERLALLSFVVTKLKPKKDQLLQIICNAEGASKNADPELQVELEKMNSQLRGEFLPLAQLHDLRSSGGVAHRQSLGKVGAAASSMGLPKEKWARRDYLELLRLITASIDCASGHMLAAAEAWHSAE